MFSADLAPDKFADGISQTFSGDARNYLAKDGSVTARVGPGFARLVFPLKCAEKCEHVSAPHRFGQIRRGSRLPAERGFELEFFVRGIAISVVAGLAAFHARSHIGNIAQTSPRPAASF